MASDVQIVGSVTGSPAFPTGPESSSDSMDISASRRYANVGGDQVTIAATDGSPFVINGGGEMAIRLFALRSVEGRSLKVKVSSALGAHQVLPASDSFLIHCPSPAPAITGVEVVGSGLIEFMVAGDAGGVPPPPPVVGASTLDVIDSGQHYVEGMNEQVMTQFSTDLSLLPATLLRVNLTAQTLQTLGASGTYFVRLGGTDAVSDGLIVATLSTIHAAYPNVPDEVLGPPFANPVSTVLVKITGNASAAAPARASIKGAHLVFGSA